jgi:hypothetical protein
VPRHGDRETLAAVRTQHRGLALLSLTVFVFVLQPNALVINDIWL